MRNHIITPASSEYLFWIQTKIKSFMFCEPPQRKSAFHAEGIPTNLTAYQLPKPLDPWEVIWEI